MPKRKRKSIGQMPTKAKKIKLLRANETNAQRQQRLQAMKDHDKTSRANESEDQRDRRLQIMREKASTSRITESVDQREHRLQKMRKQASTLRTTESESQRQHRLQLKRIQSIKSRVIQSHSKLSFEGFHYDPMKDYSKHENVMIGGMNQICKYCSAKKYKCEPLDDFIRSLIHCWAKRVSNNIQGQIYHKAGSLLPLPSENAKFLQTYFIGDEEKEVNQRCENISGVRRDIVLHLQRMFHESNQLIKTFKTALEDMPSDECKVVIRADKRPVGEHERRFNNPQINEVAIIIAGTDCDRRDIVIQKRGGSLQRIAETNRSYDALQYPIIFWQIED
ncbi:hypothetical protein AVEN_137402-1 [Araneus ventricosus]|uniref:STPR domain-containing protein n=1 Tax=Araneus ventricosus TaxID=182803 RepID=A0A4Y2KIR8_ARAVE|nr:hypothetical protein AVEN_137402-1 [Araneus ventricosus]